MRSERQQQHLQIRQRVSHILNLDTNVDHQLKKRVEIKRLSLHRGTRQTYQLDVLVQQKDSVIEPILLDALGVQWKAVRHALQSAIMLSRYSRTDLRGPCMIEILSLTRLLLPAQVTG